MDTRKSVGAERYVTGNKETEGCIAGGCIVRDGKELRTGYTTGSCAAAAAKAAARMLLNGGMVCEMSLDTPSGVWLSLTVEDVQKLSDRVSCCVVKDAGDDPDVTHGIRITAEVAFLSPQENEDFPFQAQEKYSTIETISAAEKLPLIRIDGGQGVGRVTLPGLACAVGEAAINPVPRRMIEQAVREEAVRACCKRGLSVVISAGGGEELAKHTFNPRLGIVGGISILGTSGIVEPMSEKALIDTIRLEIDQKLADGRKDLLICPGNYGRDFALREYGLDLDTGVKCSNFIGEALDYAVYRKVAKILLVGHAGKLLKLAGGVMNTHSRVADCRREIVTAHAALAGADRTQAALLMAAATTDEMDSRLTEWGLADVVWATLLGKVREVLDYRTGGQCQTEVVIFTKNTVRQTTGTQELLARLTSKKPEGAGLQE